MTKSLSRLAPLASAALITAVCAAPAAYAADGKAQPRGGSSDAVCAPDLIDSSGLVWDLDENDASVGDGGTPDVVDDRGDADYLSDTYDGYGYAAVGETGDDDFDRGGTEYGYWNEDEDGCTFENGGREIVYPRLANVSGTGIAMQRKVYVPSSGPAFARWLDILTNPSDRAITVPYRFSGNYGEINGVTATTDGDLVVEEGERWASFRQGEDGEPDDQGDQASLWDGPGGRDAWDSVWSPDDELPGSKEDPADFYAEDDVDLRYDSVTIPAGGTAVFMHVEHQNRTHDGAQAFAEANGEGNPAFFSGMSTAEIVALRNWEGDADADGLKDRSDNCPSVANAGQANLDGDALGDACDDDMDADGIPNGVEAGLGTNPSSADSDGDGIVDGGDQCPALAGPVNGCPTPVTVVQSQASTGRALPTGVTLNLSVRRGANASKAKARAAQRGGVTVRTTGRIQLPQGLSTSACKLGRIAVVIKTGSRTISTRVLDVNPDCTYRSNVTFRRKLGRTVRAKSYFFGSTGLVGRAAKSKSARVR